MNLCLLESFGQSYPEEVDCPLDPVSSALTCEFNRRGTLLAVGCNDGRIVIWDFLTRGIAKVITAHLYQICSLSWSRNGRRLLSSATDNSVSIWDVLSGAQERTFKFPTMLEKAVFNPRNEFQIMVCPVNYAPLLIRIDEKDKTVDDRKLVPLVNEDNCVDMIVAASFDRKGKYLYVGNGKGRICVYDSASLELKASFTVLTGTISTTSIKAIEFARRGNSFLVNSSDRVIRIYESDEILLCGLEGEPEPVQKLQDLVNKTQWKKVVFSGDGEYVCGASLRAPSLYIWEKSVGCLVKILHGAKGDVLLDAAWHPVRPIVCSVANGLVTVWAQSQNENWSAFTPDFRELEENVEYDECEGEFDTFDEDKPVPEMEEGEEEDILVDVDTVDPIAAFMSSDEEQEDSDALLFLPITVEVDDPEEPEATPAVDVEGKGKKRSDQEASKDGGPGTGSPEEASSGKRPSSVDRPRKAAKTNKKRSSGRGADE